MGVLKALRSAWKSLAAEEQQGYALRAAEDQERFRAELQVFWAWISFNFIGYVGADNKGNPPLATQSRTWICFIKWAEKNQATLFHANHKAKARSAARFGYARLLQGLDRRPQLAKGSQAFQYLLHYFRDTRGPNKNLDKTINIPATAAHVQECPEQYRITYHEIAKNAKNNRGRDQN